jgi:mannosyltransferase OCH1-like enzyme
MQVCKRVYLDMIIKYIVIFVLFIFLIFIAYKLYEINNKIDLSNYLENSQIIPTLLTDQKIPKIIIQTWKTDTVPQRYMKLINTIKETNPDYDYKFFTDETIEDFFKQFYPEYYNTYLNLPLLFVFQ